MTFRPAALIFFDVLEKLDLSRLRFAAVSLGSQAFLDLTTKVSSIGESGRAILRGEMKSPH